MAFIGGLCLALIVIFLIDLIVSLFAKRPGVGTADDSYRFSHMAAEVELSRMEAAEREKRRKAGQPDSSHRPGDSGDKIKLTPAMVKDAGMVAGGGVAVGGAVALGNAVQVGSASAVMHALAVPGTVVGGGVVAGIGIVGGGAGLGTAVVLNKTAFKNNKAAQIGSVAGALVGTAASVGTMAVVGAGPAGLAAIGRFVGGAGMVAGATTLLTAPGVCALVIGGLAYLGSYLYQCNKDRQQPQSTQHE